MSRGGPSTASLVLGCLAVDPDRSSPARLAADTGRRLDAVARALETLAGDGLVTTGRGGASPTVQGYQRAVADGRRVCGVGRVWVATAAHPGATARAIAVAARVAPHVAATCLRRLALRGAVRCEAADEGAPRARARRWWVTDGA